MNKSIPSIVLLFLYLFLLLVSSCEQESSSEQPDVTFKRTDNEIISRMLGEPDQLNPLFTVQTDSKAILYQTHSYLLFPDLATFKMGPQLAKARPEIEEITEGPDAGNIKFTFELYEEAVWDNGTPITANDVIFTWKSVLHPGLHSAYTSYLFFIKDVIADTENPKKFTVITNTRYYNALDVLGGLMFILPEYFYDPDRELAKVPFQTFTDENAIKAVVEQSEALKAFAKKLNEPRFSHEPASIVGSGPYQIEKWEPGQEIVLTKKENWWGNALASENPSLEAFPDRLIYKPIPNGATALAALKAEEIDIMTRIDPKDYTDIKNNEWVNEHYNLIEQPWLAVFLMYINNQNPKLADKKVRQALAHAMDVDAFIENVYYGFGQRTTGYPFPAYDYYNKDLPIIRYNPDKAKALLKEAGWEDTNGNGVVDKVLNGERTELSVSAEYVINRETSQSIMELMKNTLKSVGIDLTLAPKENQQVIKNRTQGNFELTSSGSLIQHIAWEPRQSIHSEAAKGGNNYSRFINAEADALIERLRNTIDEGERTKLYKELQALIYEEQPIIYFFNPTNLMAIHKRFDGPTTAISPNFWANHFKLKPEFAK